LAFYLYLLYRYNLPLNTYFYSVISVMLTFEQQKENRESVHNVWRISFGHTTHSLINGLYQGWDLNPAQLPMRYAATYNFFLSSYEDAVFRLKTFVERAAISTLTKDIFDDAATGQGLLNFS